MVSHHLSFLCRFIQSFAIVAGNKKFNFKAALGDKRMSQIDDWVRDNLTQNLVQLCTKCLSRAI